MVSSPASQHSAIAEDSSPGVFRKEREPVADRVKEHAETADGLRASVYLATEENCG